MIVHNIFPTSVMEFDLNNSIDTKLLWNEIKTMQIEDHPLLTKGGKSSYFPGNADLLDLEIPLISKLRKEIEKSLEIYTNQVGLIPVILTNSWLSIMNKNSSLLSHRHEASTLSGAYYPNVPEGSVGLTFTNPLKPYRMCEIYAKSTEYSADEGTMPVKQGVLYIWPSWLEHKSETNNVDDRAVISFNTVNNATTTNYSKRLVR